jgi:seryl-tRNA synthetase
MVATLPIYNSIQDQEPSKVYTCYRTTIAIDNKLEEMTEETNAIHQQINELVGTITEETTKEEVERIKEAAIPLKEKASQLTFESILLFFPEFTAEDFQKLDPMDYQNFCAQIGEMRGRIYTRAKKN